MSELHARLTRIALQELTEQAYATVEDQALAMAAAMETCLRESRTITTVEELDALPTFAVVREADGAIQEKKPDHFGDRWFQPAWTGGRLATDLNLPALLLWHPDRAGA